MWEQINSIDQLSFITKDVSILKYPDDHTEPVTEIPRGDEKNSTKYNVLNKTFDTIELVKETGNISTSIKMTRSVLFNDLISGTWWYDNGK